MKTCYYCKSDQTKILQEAMQQQNFVDGELGYKIYKRARILPSISNNLYSGGVCQESGEYIQDSALYENVYDGSYPFLREKIVRRNKTAIYIGTWARPYGHFLTDNIKKFWFFFTEEYKQIISNSEVDYIYNLLGNEELPGYANSIFRALGLDDNLITSFCRVNDVTQYDRVIIPENAIVLIDGLYHYYPKFTELIERICHNCLSDKVFPDKIYLSRRNLHDRKDFGEAELEESFKSMGYSVIYPEVFPFVEQVAMMHNCKSLAVTEGSVSHNSIFCSEGTSVVLLRKADYLNNYTILINKIRKLDATFVDAHHSIVVFDPWSGPFFLYKTKYFVSFSNGGGKKFECTRWFSHLWYKYLYCIVRIKLRSYKSKLRKMLIR